MLTNSSFQVCMDTTDWLKAIVHEDAAGASVTPMLMDSTSSSPSPSADLLSSRPPPQMVVERRLRPPHDQALKCPRCDSTHTKFCYYNNYSLSQPRYFCKTCRRYWTKGGSLRNVPVGGGCRKNKRSGGGGNAKNKPLGVGDHHHHPPPALLHHFAQQQQLGSPSSSSLSFSSYMDGGAAAGTELHLSTLSGLLPQLSHAGGGGGGGAGHRGIANFMECKYDSMFDVPDQQVGVVDAKFGAIVGNTRGLFFPGIDVGSGDVGGLGYEIDGASHGFHGAGATSSAAAFHGVSTLGFSMDHGGGGVGNHGASLIENCQRLALPWSANDDDTSSGAIETKPSTAGKLLSLEWQQEHGCAEVGRENYGYSGNGVGVLWGGVVSGHGSSAATASNPLV